MKKIVALAMIVVSLWLGLASAEDKKTPFVGQWSIAADRTFLEVRELFAIEGNAMLMGSTQSPGVSLFTYLGPKVRLADGLYFYLLGGAYLDAGSSIITSAWLDYSPTEQDNFFGEIDYYTPYLEQLHAIYLYGAYTRSTELNFDYGFAYEAMEYTRDGKFFESAIGPFLKLENIKFWLAYDETPSMSGDQVILRANYSF